MASSWPGIRQLRSLLGGRPEQQIAEEEEENTRQQFTLLIDLAEMGTQERVTQLKQYERQFQRMLEDAADAYREQLRPT